MRVLVVEDEKAIAQDIVQILREEGFVADWSRDGEDALFRGENESFDAILLDLGLPSIDGKTVLERWRKAGIITPVIILTARDDWKDRVAGIDAGADDYVTKPFHKEEILARLRSGIRRSAGRATSTITIRDLTLDTLRKRISRGGEAILLTSLEYRLVSYLMHHAGRPVPQGEIMEHIYDQADDHDSNTLEALVARVRRKVGSDVIVTKRGFGYMVAQS
jgi:two-component system OmpR family response regulator